MKTSVSLPEPLFKEVEALAKKLGVSRSKLAQTALKEFLRHRREDKLSESIDRYIAKYGNDLSAEDEAWLAHCQATLLRELRELERDE